MTLNTFAKKTGWPLDELIQLNVDEFVKILDLMDLVLVWDEQETCLAVLSK
jgi:hypothetical protein